MTDWQLIVKSLTTSGLLVAGLMSFLVGRRLSKQGQFYSDVPKPLIGLGIFVWGDALILGPFWVISTMLLLLAEASILDILRYFLGFLRVKGNYRGDLLDQPSGGQKTISATVV